MSKTLVRHSRGAIVMHWFNAVVFIILLLSGLAMLRNPEMTVVGLWWSNLWDGVFGAEALLSGHIRLGIAWVLGVLVYATLYSTRDVIPFLREIFNLKPASDIAWCVRKGLRLTIGAANMKKLGLNPELPPQGFYNAGQKLAAIAVVFCGTALALSGLILYANTVTPLGDGLAQFCLLAHLSAAVLMLIVLPIHIYMAALAPGEGPALRSMFTGTVPASFAEHHNPLWHAEAINKENSADLAK